VLTSRLAARSTPRGSEHHSAGLGHPGRRKLGHRPPKGLLRQCVQVVEVHDAVRRHAIILRRKLKLGNETPDGSREGGHDDSADAISNRVARQDEDGPVTSRRRGEPDLTPPHQPSPPNPRQDPSPLWQTTRVRHHRGAGAARPPRRSLRRDDSTGGGARRAAARIDRPQGGQPSPAPAALRPHRPGSSASSYDDTISYDRRRQRAALSSGQSVRAQARAPGIDRPASCTVSWLGGKQPVDLLRANRSDHGQDPVSAGTSTIQLCGRSRTSSASGMAAQTVAGTLASPLRTDFGPDAFNAQPADHDQLHRVTATPLLDSFACRRRAGPAFRSGPTAGTRGQQIAALPAAARPLREPRHLSGEPGLQPLLAVHGRDSMQRHHRDKPQIRLTGKTAAARRAGPARAWRASRPAWRS
jgi:hypothetical protein